MQKDIISSDLLKESLIEVRHIRPTIDKVDEIPHRHPFQEIIFIISGTGKHAIDGEVFHLTPNTVYVIGEGQIHEFKKGSNLNGYVLRYKESFLPSEFSMFTAKYSLFQMISDSNSLPLSKAEAKAFKANFEELKKERENSETLEQNQVFHFLMLTLLSRVNRKIIQSSEFSISSHHDHDERLYRGFILSLEDHFKKEHSTEFYSKQLGVHPRHLAKVLLAKSGLNTKHLINRRLIIEAKRLLKFTNLSFKEISYGLGYTEPAYFSRLFKIKSGMSPKAYRGSKE